MENESIVVGGERVPLHRYAEGAGELPDLSAEDWRQSAAECWEGGVDALYRWPLAGAALYIYVDQGMPVGAEITTASAESYVLGLDHGCDDAEMLAGWGLDGLSVLAEASAEHTGPCRVWREPQYYQGTCDAPAPGYARDDDGEIIEWDSYAEAAEYVREYYEAPSGYDGIPACNVLAHGQSGPDTLTIVEA